MFGERRSLHALALPHILSPHLIARLSQASCAICGRADAKSYVTLHEGRSGTETTGSPVMTVQHFGPMY